MIKFDFMGIQNLTCEQRFLSCMAFNIFNKVIHVAYQFCTWPVLYTGCNQPYHIPVPCQTFHMMHNEILYQTDD